MIGADLWGPRSDLGVSGAGTQGAVMGTESGPAFPRPDVCLHAHTFVRILCAYIFDVHRPHTSKCLMCVHSSHVFACVYMCASVHALLGLCPLRCMYVHDLCTCVRVSMCVCFSMSMCLWVHMSVMCHMSQAPPFPRRVHGTRRHSARDTCGHQDALPRLLDLPFACGTALAATAGRSGQTPGTSQHLQPRGDLWAPPASTCSRPARHHSGSPRHSRGDQLGALAAEDQARPREQVGNRAPTLTLGVWGTP